MVLGQTADLGFNPMNVVKSAARVAGRVVADPNVQRAAAASAQQYAPQQYARGAAYAQQAQAAYRRYVVPPQQPPMPMPEPQMVSVAPDESAIRTPGQTVRSSHGLLLGGVVALGLLALLMTRK